MTLPGPRLSDDHAPALTFCLLIAIAAFVPSCGGNAGSNQDGGPGVGTNDARDAPPRVDECSLVLQDCAAGMMCQMSCGTGGAAAKCFVDSGGTALPGEACNDLNPCAKGNYCGPTQICAKYCDTGTDCVDGGVCSRFILQCPVANWPFGTCGS